MKTTGGRCIMNFTVRSAPKNGLKPLGCPSRADLRTSPPRTERGFMNCLRAKVSPEGEPYSSPDCQCLECQAERARFYRGLSTCSTVRREIRVLRDLGFVFSGRSSKNRACFARTDVDFYDANAELSIPLAPKDDRWVKPHRHRLARMLGLNAHQLERVIAGQPADSARREPGPGRLSPAEVVERHADRLGIDIGNRAQILISEHGSVKAARAWLDRVAEAKRRRLKEAA